MKASPHRDVAPSINLLGLRKEMEPLAKTQDLWEQPAVENAFAHIV